MKHKREPIKCGAGGAKGGGGAKKAATKKAATKKAPAAKTGGKGFGKK